MLEFGRFPRILRTCSLFHDFLVLEDIKIKCQGFPRFPIPMRALLNTSSQFVYHERLRYVGGLAWVRNLSFPPCCKCWVEMKHKCTWDVYKDLPTSAGKGGFNRGLPCFPSKLSISAWLQKCSNHFRSTTTCAVFTHTKWNSTCFSCKQQALFSLQEVTSKICNLDYLLTPKIWLLILPSSCYTFLYKLVTRIWCSIETIIMLWLISLNILTTCLLSNVWTL